MSVFTGQVVKVNGKSGQGKFGPWELRSICLGGANNGDDVWVSVGFNPTPKKPNPLFDFAVEGGYLKVTADEQTSKDGKKFWSATSIERAEPPKPAVATASPAGGPAAKSITKDEYIHYQNSRTLAADVVFRLIDNKAFPLAAKEGKAGVEARYEEVLAGIDKLTVRFYHDLQTFRIFDSVDDPGADAEPSEADVIGNDKPAEGSTEEV